MPRHGKESGLPTLDGSRLTLDDIVAVSRRTAGVSVDPSARERVAASHDFADGVAAFATDELRESATG